MGWLRAGRVGALDHARLRCGRGDAGTGFPGDVAYDAACSRSEAETVTVSRPVRLAGPAVAFRSRRSYWTISLRASMSIGVLLPPS
jgi:hypothetical protein